MNLTKEDYDKLLPFKEKIQATANTSNQSDTSPWYVMDQIKFDRTGFRSNGMCSSCVIELYREFWGLIKQYEGNGT